jgi:hypothetical protein
MSALDPRMNAHGERLLPAHRRLICCVLAIEIADHDSLPVFDQIRITQDLRSVLLEATTAVPPQDLICVAREDGALLGFLADPAACFDSALQVREACLTQERYRDLQPRMGIDLGPAEVLEEELGQAYLGGEARRDAERVMRQSPPRQIGVTRSFFELLARASPDLSRRLRHQGLLSDTMGRALGWYALDSAIPAAAPVEAARPAGEAGGKSGAAAPDAGPALLRAPMRFVLLAAAALALALAPTGRVHDPGGADPSAAALYAAHVSAGGEIAPVPDTAALDRLPEARASRKRTGAPAPSHPMSSEPVTAAAPAAFQERAATTPAIPIASDAATAHPARPSPPSDPADRASTPGSAKGSGGRQVRLAIRPWGEVYVDGRKVGITPPLKSLRLAPGRHVVTIRNGTLPAYRRELVVRSGTSAVVLEHRFGCVQTRDLRCPEADDTPLLASSRFHPRTTHDRVRSGTPTVGRIGRPPLAAGLPERSRETPEQEAVAARAH